MPKPIGQPIAMKLFDTEIKPILTYGGVICGTESGNHDILIGGFDENNNKTIMEQINDLLENILHHYMTTENTAFWTVNSDI